MAFAEITLQLAAFRLLALLILVGVQGAAIAGAAALLGDPGPRYDGRLSAMPTGHVDGLGLVAAILFGMGWGKPVDVDAREMRPGRAGLVLVALAGIMSLLVVAAILNALVLPALTGLPDTAGLTTAAFLRSASGIAIWFALLNLLPDPAADRRADPRRLRPEGLPKRAMCAARALLLAALATGVVERLLAPAHAALAAALPWRVTLRASGARRSGAAP